MRVKFKNSDKTPRRGRGMGTVWDQATLTCSPRGQRAPTVREGRASRSRSRGRIEVRSREGGRKLLSLLISFKLLDF